MKIFSQDLMWSLLKEGTQSVTLTIVPAISDATVTLEADGYATVAGIGAQSITVVAGVDIIYTVEKNDYTTVQRTVVLYKSRSINVPLTNLPTKTVTVVPVPNDAAVQITCVETGVTTIGKTAQVSQGYHVEVTATKSGLTSVTETFVVSANDESNTHNVIMGATIYWGTLIPTDATKTLSVDSAYQNPTYNASKTVPCTTQAVYWRAERTGYVTQSGAITPTEVDENGVNYMLDTQVPVVSPMLLEEWHYTVNVAQPVDATVVVNIYNPNTGQNRVITGTGTTVVSCYMGEELSWTVSKQYYQSESSSTPTTINTDGLSTAAITLQPSVNYVTISCAPVSGTVYLYVDDVLVASGVGQVYYPVPLGSYFKYYAEYAGVTSDMSTPAQVLSTSANYNNTVVLNAESQTVEIITATETRTLQPGRYYYIMVGGGAAGGYYTAPREGNKAAGRWQIYGGLGGFGGSSGYIAFGNFMIDSAHEFVLTVGAGGTPSTNADERAGKETSIVSSTANISVSVSGGTNVTGGSGAGAHGGRQTKTYSSNSGGIVETYGSPSAGGNGSVGGGNGADTISYTSPTAYTYAGGVGYYNTAKNYENNGGRACTSASVQGGGGHGGRGLISMQNTLTPAFLSQLTDLQVLYNAIGGGGGGGGTIAANTSATVQDYRPGSGGGGGGWFNGEDATDASSSVWSTAGHGGGGAIIIARTAWE